jgi:hypothetical protein
LTRVNAHNQLIEGDGRWTEEYQLNGMACENSRLLGSSKTSRMWDNLRNSESMCGRTENDGFVRRQPIAISPGISLLASTREFILRYTQATGILAGGLQHP